MLEEFFRLLRTTPVYDTECLGLLAAKLTRASRFATPRDRNEAEPTKPARPPTANPLGSITEVKPVAPSMMHSRFRITYAPGVPSLHST